MSAATANVSSANAKLRICSLSLHSLSQRFRRTIRPLQNSVIRWRHFRPKSMISSEVSLRSVPAASISTMYCTRTGNCFFMVQERHTTMNWVIHRSGRMKISVHLLFPRGLPQLARVTLNDVKIWGLSAFRQLLPRSESVHSLCTNTADLPSLLFRRI